MRKSIVRASAALLLGSAIALGAAVPAQAEASFVYKTSYKDANGHSVFVYSNGSRTIYSGQWLGLTSGDPMQQ